MSFDFQRVLESKQTCRRKLAMLPPTEKLRLLDELRARALAIRRAGDRTQQTGRAGEARRADHSDQER